MSEFPIWLQISIAVGPAIAVYAGVRADLREAMTVAKNAEKHADGAHDRIDGMMQRR